METNSRDFSYCIMYWKRKLYIYKQDCETSDNLSLHEMRVAQD